ncbi:MAG: aminotransferase class V-fold PLP-dependent enzyme [Pseudomonadota bacterium]
MAGRHFLQIPGPSAVPERILRAIYQQVIDHRGPDFGPLGLKCLNGMKRIFKTDSTVVIYPASGTGAWEAALVNTCSPGDKVLMFETGHFASLWHKLASRVGLDAHVIESDWRAGANAEAIHDALKADTGHTIHAVCVVHNETSTGCTSQIAKVRKAIDDAGHPALLFVDTISGLASAEFRMDEWGVDVTVSGSQKGLMLPPGLSFNAFSTKALEAHKKAACPRAYWDWSDMMGPNANGYFPYTNATNMLYGLAEAIDMLEEEGLDNVFARHQRHAKATRAACQAWGLEVQCTVEAEHSPVLTTVRMPEGHSADAFRSVVLDRFDMSLGSGLSKVADKVFRIGHLGDFNDLMLMGTLSGVEMGLGIAGVPHQKGGCDAAMRMLEG